jgi:hypothetical protein
VKTTLGVAAALMLAACEPVMAGPVIDEPTPMVVSDILEAPVCNSYVNALAFQGAAKHLDHKYREHLIQTDRCRYLPRGTRILIMDPDAEITVGGAILDDRWVDVYTFPGFLVETGAAP